MTHFLLLLLVVTLVTARASHLVVDDSITQPLRDKLHAAAFKGIVYDPETGQPSKSNLKNKVARWGAELTACVHCTSVWLAAAVTFWASLVVDTDYDLLVWVAVAAGASYLTGLLAVWRYSKDSF